MVSFMSQAGKDRLVKINLMKRVQAPREHRAMSRSTENFSAVVFIRNSLPLPQHQRFLLSWDPLTSVILNVFTLNMCMRSADKAKRGVPYQYRVKQRKCGVPKENFNLRKHFNHIFPLEKLIKRHTCAKLDRFSSFAKSKVSKVHSESSSPKHKPSFRIRY